MEKVRFEDVKVGDTVLTPKVHRGKVFLIREVVSFVKKKTFETTCNRTWNISNGQHVNGTLSAFKEGDKYYNNTIASDQSREYTEFKNA